jgi:transposase
LNDVTIVGNSSGINNSGGTLEGVMNLSARYPCAMNTQRKPYPSDVSDPEWCFVAPSLTLMSLDAPQRDHDLREVFNGLRWLVRSGSAWRMLPHDLPPWAAVYQQTRRWLDAGSFDAIVHDLRAVLRLAAGRDAEPTATIFDSRTLQSSVESGERAGYDGYKRKRGSKVHLAVDTLGHLLALHVTPADEQDRAQVGMLAAAVQRETGDHVTLAYVDQGYTGETPAAEAEAHGMTLEVVKMAEAKRGFVLLSRRWVVERSFAWMARFRRLARDYERLPETLAGLHLVAFVFLMLQSIVVHAFPVHNTL